MTAYTRKDYRRMDFNIITDKARKAWYSSVPLGKLKWVYYKYLQHCYRFQEWHTTPINFRPYAIGIVDDLNKKPKKKVVEIGCGLGEIIGNLKGCERKGLDLDARVIKAAGRLYRNTHFCVGSFANIMGEKIDYLITVNFIHAIAPEELKRDYQYLCGNNDIKNIVLDVTDSPNYQYVHDVHYLFDELGYVVKRLKGYQVIKGRRWIYILEKVAGESNRAK